MRTLRRFVFLWLLAAGVLLSPRVLWAARDFPAPVFPEEFSSKEVLKEWAETSAMGGQLEEIPHERMGVRLYVVYRSYTSGVPSSDLGVYTALKTGEYKLRYAYPDVLYGSIAAEKTEKGISFVHHDLGDKTRVLKDFTLADVLGTVLCKTSQDCKAGFYCLDLGSAARQPPMCFDCPDHLEPEKRPEDCR